jgi:LAO/AO transport system kinase
MVTLEGFLSGDKRAIARAISIVENGTDTRILERIFKHTGSAYHVGITGPPGAGKSTLVNAVTKQMLKKKKRIGIIAVDPTSPFSGGALLGDRIRMTDLALNDNVFIRSMASRGSLGGLAQTTKDVALVMDAAGMDFILIETIGVGQVELDIAQVCDTTVVVLVPESGDSIQAMKAGLLEIADIIVVNKGDREGCERLLTELKFAFEMKEQKAGWQYPILQTIATEDKGITELVTSIESHSDYLTKTGKLESDRKSKIMLHVHELIEQNIRSHLKERVIRDDELVALVDKIYRRENNPYRVAQRLTRQIVKSSR